MMAFSCYLHLITLYGIKVFQLFSFWHFGGMDVIDINDFFNQKSENPVRINSHARRGNVSLVP